MADDQGRCSICSFCLFESDPSFVSLAHLHHRSALFGQASYILFSPYLVLFPIILIMFSRIFFMLPMSADLPKWWDSRRERRVVPRWIPYHKHAAEPRHPRGRNV